MSKTVSEILVDTLLEAGARRCYGIVGDTINHLTDAVHRSDMDWVHVRHEETGALAAGGEAYMQRELAVCAGTCGPGSLHFLNGIFESHRNGAPVVLIASTVDRGTRSRLWLAWRARGEKRRSRVCNEKMARSRRAGAS